MGFNPTTPQKDAGWRTDPPVSEPIATAIFIILFYFELKCIKYALSLLSTIPADTLAAAPPELPPQTNGAESGGVHGLIEGPKAEFVVELPIPNSSIFV